MMRTHQGQPESLSQKWPSMFISMVQLTFKPRALWARRGIMLCTPSTDAQYGVQMNK